MRKLRVITICCCESFSACQSPNKLGLDGKKNQCKICIDEIINVINIPAGSDEQIQTVMIQDYPKVTVITTTAKSGEIMSGHGREIKLEKTNGKWLKAGEVHVDF